LWIIVICTTVSSLLTPPTVTLYTWEIPLLGHCLIEEYILNWFLQLFLHSLNTPISNPLYMGNTSAWPLFDWRKYILNSFLFVKTTVWVKNWLVQLFLHSLNTPISNPLYMGNTSAWPLFGWRKIYPKLISTAVSSLF
jgi:hypothetical protein